MKLWKLGACLFFISGAVLQAQDTKHPLAQFTGARTKVLWAQHQGQRGTYLTNANQLLFGLDTATDSTERLILPQKANYSRPLISPDGATILYSSKTIRDETIELAGASQKLVDSTIYSLSWPAAPPAPPSNLLEEVSAWLSDPPPPPAPPRALAEGYALDIWRDPDTSHDWVYAGRKLSRLRNITAQQIIRFPLHNPSAVEILWEGRPVTVENWQISRSGKIASAVAPWPHVGRFYVKTRQWEKAGNGCWGSLAPDDSGLLWIFHGNHRRLTLFHEEKTWPVSLGSAPGVGRHEVYHPRWSNHPLYFVLTGPYTEGVGQGGDSVEVILGRFAPDLGSVEAWYTASANSKGDYFPDLWIEGGENTSIDLPALSTAGSNFNQLASAPWPIVQNQLLALWKNHREANVITLEGTEYLCTITPSGVAYFDPHFAMQLAGGAFALDRSSNERIAQHLNGSPSWTLEILLTPAPIHFKSKTASAILSFFTHKEDLAFSLLQRGDQLLWNEADAQPLVLGKLYPNTPMHLAISSSAQGLEFFLNGKASASRSRKVSYPKGAHPRLQFGRLPAEEKSWRGTLEAFAFYAHTLSFNEISSHYRTHAENLARRPQRATLKIRGTLLEHTPIPDPANIGQYTRALGIGTYRVEEVIEGDYSDDRIYVLQWVILDREMRAPFSSSQPILLQVEKASDHPQLESESRAELDDFNIELYYETAPPK